MMFVTKKQYELVEKALKNMVQLYQNDPVPLFKDIAEWYGSGESAAADAAKIITELPIITPNITGKERAENLYVEWKRGTAAIQEGKYQYAVDLTNAQMIQLSKILDAYSRIMMGQLHILFEAMDIPARLGENPHMLQMYHDAYWDGACGAKEARDLLFPEIKDLGWHGGYGIANQRVAEDSRLAYQISRAMQGEYALSVTREPPVLVGDGLCFV